MDVLRVDGWTLVGSRTYSATLTRVEIADGLGNRLSMLVPRSATSYDELVPLIRARIAAARPLPPERPD